MCVCVCVRARVCVQCDDGIVIVPSPGPPAGPQFWASMKSQLSCIQAASGEFLIQHVNLVPDYEVTLGVKNIGLPQIEEPE